MKSVSLALLACIAIPAQADTFKCVNPATGRAEFKQAAIPPEGCQPVAIKAQPYIPAEAERAKQAMERIEAHSRAFDEGQARQQAERERLFALQQQKRAADEQARARAVGEQQLRELKRSNATHGWRYGLDELR